MEKVDRRTRDDKFFSFNDKASEIVTKLAKHKNDEALDDFETVVSVSAGMSASEIADMYDELDV